MNQTSAVPNHRILIIDDNPSIHEDFRKVLCRRETRHPGFAETKALLFGADAPEPERTMFEVDSAFQGEEGLRKVQQALAAGRAYALAFVDIRMPPGWDGVETVARIWESDPDLQTVICTAHSDYSWNQMTQRLGEADNLVILKKPFDNIEVLQLAHALIRKWELRHQLHGRLNDLDQLVRDRTAELLSTNERLKQEIAERAHVDKALRLSEERFAKAFRASPFPLAIQSVARGRYVDANHGFETITGFTREELLGHTSTELNILGDASGANAILEKIGEKATLRDLPCRLRTKAGQLRDTLLSVEFLELESEPCILIIARDITEQLKLENQLRQAQKMEAIGQLAAGIAHDFNNILTVVQGYTSLLLSEKTPESSDYEPLQTVSAAAARAARLIRQLLAFSRRQVMQLRTIDIHDTLAAISQMFPQMLGEHIDVKIVAAPGLPLVRADSGMIEQVLINLAVNARDAMPNGGRLVITAKAVRVMPQTAPGNPEARPGSYLCLSVTDTGCGMTRETMARIFDPFFTTKPIGKGTGLGLATVYGIAKQHSGWVEVQSEVNRGTTFQVFIPSNDEALLSPSPTSVTKVLQGGRENVLLVEDEEAVRTFVAKVLKSHGYTVHAAHSGVEALALWRQIKPKVDLLLTDLVMPGGVMGRELAERLLAKDPTLKVIYSSGYSPGMAGKDLKLLEGRNFLPKPYDPSQLLQVVRECFDGEEKTNSSNPPALG
jgi:two-component system, cell cycle sensor histidine kinase and response regulator CckA